MQQIFNLLKHQIFQSNEKGYNDNDIMKLKMKKLKKISLHCLF